jgi:hypothetical protein
MLFNWRVAMTEEYTAFFRSITRGTFFLDPMTSMWLIIGYIATNIIWMAPLIRWVLCVFTQQSGFILVRH